MPDRVAAGHHGALGVFGFSGTNPRTGRFFSFFDTAHGGWGGSTHGDGVGPYKTIRHADNKDIPVETLEALYPLLVERYAWRTNSGGPGDIAADLASTRPSACLRHAISIFLLNASGVRHGVWRAAFRVAGLCRSGDGERNATVRKVSQRPLVSGDRVCLHTGGGGGYGPPEQRDLALIKARSSRRLHHAIPGCRRL